MIFGGSGIEQECFQWIINNIQHGSKFLELGSGAVSTQYLSQYFDLYSVEDNPEFIGLYKSTYIYAPLIRDDWYSLEVLKKELPSDYKGILIDGPKGGLGRLFFYVNRDLFNLNVPLIFHDIDRPFEEKLFERLAAVTGKRKVYFDNNTAGVLL